MNKFKPAQKLIVPNDKICKKIFETTDENFKNFLTGSILSVNEGKDQEGAKVSTFIKLKSQQPNIKPPNMFDRAVFTACVSEYDAGNTQLTPAIIYRMINGKNTHTQKPTEKQSAEILESVLKMSQIFMTSNLTDTFKRLGYNNGKPLKIENKAILPCEIRHSEGNDDGKFAKVLINLSEQSPLMCIANAKRQLLTINDFRALLDTGQVNSDITAAKFYTLIRISETLGSRKLTPIITFADIFEKCRIKNATRKAKMFVRNAITAEMENFFCMELITNFEIKKSDDGKFHSIEFKKK